MHRYHIIILFHKNDKVDKIEREQVENLQNLILDISTGFEIEFFRTTLFEPQTLMNAYSHGINKISKKTSELSAQLEKMARETFADAIILVENNGFIIGEYAKNDESREMIMNIYMIEFHKILNKLILFILQLLPLNGIRDII